MKLKLTIAHLALISIAGLSAAVACGGDDGDEDAMGDGDHETGDGDGDGDHGHASFTCAEFCLASLDACGGEDVGQCEESCEGAEALCPAEAHELLDCTAGAEELDCTNEDIAGSPVECEPELQALLTCAAATIGEGGAGGR